jgi:hypothetical protein
VNNKASSMRSARRWRGIYVAILASTFVLASPTIRAATIMGSGITISCGGWVELRKTPNKGPVEEWSLGYLSGVAMWTPVSPLDGLDAGAVLVWLDNFCQQNPLAPFKIALDEFVRQRAAAAQQRPGAQPAPAPSPQNRR